MKDNSRFKSTVFNLRTTISFALVCAAAVSVHADIITVTTTADSGPGSLRQALADAQDGDTIQFDAALNGQTIGLESSELVIDKNITISGPGPGLLTVARHQQAADFRIFNIPPSHTAEIDGLTITGGSLVGNGGGISSGATLTISNCAISGNSITADGVEYSGAGIYNVGTMTIVNSTVNNNRALIVGKIPPFGGGISNDGGTLTIQNTTISGNTVAGTGWGGGVYSAGSLTAVNSTIRGNTGSSGGGIMTSFFIATNCTISGNSAVFEGGGIYGGGTISNCTITGNMTTTGHGRGGGISGGFTITNSTISGNVAIQGGSICATGTVQLGNTILKTGFSGANIFLLGGTVTSHGYNISDDNGAGLLTGPGDQINTDPMLGPLQDNGGPTFTHELLPGSPAIDTGDPNFTPPPFFDQRGPVFDRVVNARIDKGSFEVQGPTATPTATPTLTATVTPTATVPPSPTPTPTPSPCFVNITDPSCDSVINTQPVDFSVNLSDPTDPSSVQPTDFTVNGTPADSYMIFNNSRIVFHFNTSPVVQGLNVMHIPACAFKCSIGCTPEFTCTFTYQPSTPTPTPRPSPTPRLTPSPRSRPTPRPRP